MFSDHRQYTLIDSENGSNYSSIGDEAEEQDHKTLLENYWYNASMTVFQDLPQSIALIVIMVNGGLKQDPDNPTGVSLQGYLNLIPQLGNTTAGLVAAHEATRLITLCRSKPISENFISAVLYTVFSVSTIINGITNISILLANEEGKEADLLSSVSTFIALSATFLILCREEIKLLDKISRNDEGNKSNVFHLICSFNLNISITTSFLVNLGIINRNLGAYGYLFGTWFGQVPELVEPTINSRCREMI